MNATLDPSAAPPVGLAPWTPFSLTVEPIAALLNCELPTHPVYDALELQWFDDAAHGTGMLAFLSRRADRRVDYYRERGLRLDPAGYEIGGGMGAWTEVDFDVARLRVAEDGVDAEARFTDLDGRPIEIRVDDRDGRRRRRAQLLAPVSSGTERPISLLLVWLSGFDLVRAAGTSPSIRIDGGEVPLGRLPGARLHRRHLVKYAAPVCAVELNRNHDGPVRAADAAGRLVRGRHGLGTAAIVAAQGGHRARVAFEPAVPDLPALPDGATEDGRWHVAVDGTRLTGGRWWAARRGAEVQVGLDVEERWRPGRLPWLMRLVTAAVPVFRRWPTTYRWRAALTLGPAPTMTSRWERTTGARGLDPVPEDTAG